ncbi:MAG: class II poly(R)-hydroxyalkanoic acid synthase, partial [Polymorphobacter sp.]
KAKFYRAAKNPATPEAWLQGAEEMAGSWWPYWLNWLKARSGAQVAAPKTMGSKAHKPVGKAPGDYALS